MLRLALRPTAPLLAVARLRLRTGARDARARATATGASTKNADAEGIAADDEKFMRLALHEATLAAHALEVPVGAVLVEHATGAVLASHHNSTLREEDPTAHAELKCIREGAKKLGSWQKLAETTLYVTLEPCPMCAGGILNARLGAVVWGRAQPADRRGRQLDRPDGRRGRGRVRRGGRLRRGAGRGGGGKTSRSRRRPDSAARV